LSRDSNSYLQDVSLAFRQALTEDRKLELEGLGQLLLNEDNELRFVAETKPRVFIAYVQEDLGHALRVYQVLASEGFQPWLDKKKLLPGQNWPRAIETAIQLSDFFIGCFSKKAVLKRGTFQSELRYALECAQRAPLDEIFFIPLRLENCAVPSRISSQIQYVDLFPDWDAGITRVISVMRAQQLARKQKLLPLAG